jgi:hypothetical protein
MRWIALFWSAVVLLAGTTGSSTAERGSGRTAHGFAYHHDEVPEKPWSIHIVKISRTNAELELHTTLGKQSRFGLGTLSEQVRAFPPDIGRPVAAINGDYYYDDNPYVGDPKGLQISRGELISAPGPWTCFWIDPAGIPQMGTVNPRFEITWPNEQKIPVGLNEQRLSGTAVLYTSAVGASTFTRGGRELVLERNGTNIWLPLRPGESYVGRVREVRETGNTPLNRDIVVLSLGNQVLRAAPKLAPGSLVRISTATAPSLTGVKTAIGGGPLIISGGKVVSRNDRNVRHPRSAIGWNKDHIFLLEVDGRQLNLSVGMTYPELAAYMLKMGCDEAMCFDGGGSATCWVYGQVMNSPSEGRERAMANALVLVQKPPPP